MYGTKSVLLFINKCVLLEEVLNLVPFSVSVIANVPSSSNWTLISICFTL